MGASITIAGERLIAQKQADRQPLEVARFVLAYLPGLDTTQPVDRDAGLPPAEQIVYSVNISRDGSAGPNGELTREGYLSPNQVVYSLLMGTNIGDFDFNWIGLQTTEDVLLIAAYVPRQQKRRELPPLQTGNNLTRNIVLEYDGAQSLTGIEVPAASWQFDFTAQFAAMNTQIAALQAELEKKVDAASWNPPQSVSLDGPVLVYPGSSNTYQITDFDAFAVYQASSTVGSVTLAGDVLTLDVPAETPEGLATLEVRRGAAKATFKVPVGSAAIDQPVILSPTAGATNVTFEPDLAASAFVVYPAGYDSHAETRWQVARDTGFTDLVFDQQGVDNLTAISLAAAGARLDPATRYYVRAQYHGATLVSAWSVALAFNTAATYVRRPMITSPLDGAESVSSSLTLVADAFSVAGGADAHQSSRWQVSAANDFSTVLVDSGWSNSQLTAYAPTGLQQASQYYARVKYRGEALGESEWSPAISFTTSAKLSGTVTNLPGGATARYNHGAAAIDRHFYVFGGMPASGSSPLGDFWRYSVDGAAWSQIASLPASPHRKGHGVVALNGLLHVFGGVSGTASAPAWLSDHKAYNPATDAWISRAPLAVCDAAICADGDDIYAFGGYTGGGYRSGLYKYNAVSNAWATLYTGSSSTNAGAIADASLVKIGNFLYLFGGKDTAGARAALWRYDLSSNVWSQLASAPQGRAHHAAVALHGLMYVFGGVNSTSEFSTTLTDLLIYDPATDSWEQAATGLPASAAMGVDVIDGMIHWFGGLSAPTYGINNNLYRMK